MGFLRVLMKQLGIINTSYFIISLKKFILSTEQPIYKQINNALFVSLIKNPRSSQSDLEYRTKW